MDIKLYEFPHSHFCEVARWALDYKGLAYTSVPLLPGVHAAKMKRLGLHSSLPVLEVAGEFVQGASAILDYLDRQFPQKSLSIGIDIDEANKVEASIAAMIGVPIRRLCYESLLPHPELVRFCFMHRSGLLDKFAFRFLHGILNKRLIAAYDITPAGAVSAKTELLAAIETFDKELDGREYFLGSSFTRVDLTFAALFAFMVMPENYPVPWPQKFNSLEIKNWFDQRAESLSYQHVVTMYAKHRSSKI